MWSDRLTWSGEIPADDPTLNPVALCRMEDYQGNADWSTLIIKDAVNPSRVWQGVNFNASTANLPRQGQWQRQATINRGNLNTEKTSLKLPFFPGLWPSSGKLLVALWAAPRFSSQSNSDGTTATDIPLMSTRNGTAQPLVHVATNTSARPRHMVYDASGTLLTATGAANGWETFPTAWASPIGQWRWWCCLVDLDAKTSQMAAVRLATHDSWVAPARPLSGQPNQACQADLDMAYLLSAGEDYYANGEFDEVLVAQPTPGFNLAEFVERVRLGTWAQGAVSGVVGQRLAITDQSVTAVESETLRTGAERATWAMTPTVTNSAGTAVPWLSTDDGATWTTGGLPDTFDGLLRWEVALQPGETFTGITLTEPRPVPVAAPDQAETTTDSPVSINVLANDSWTGQAVVTIVSAPTQGTVAWNGTVLVYTPAPGASGPDFLRYRLTDDTDQWAEAVVSINVLPPTWTPPAPPANAFTPPAILGDDGDFVLDRVLSCVVREEVNGETTCEFSLHADDPQAARCVNEARCMVDGREFILRVLDDEDDGGGLILTVTGQHARYDLARWPLVPATSWADSQAGPELAAALEGTGWTVGTVTRTTRRTWDQTVGNPLEVIGQIAKIHGGDLVFDADAKTVSLLTTQGAARGVVYSFGRNLKTLRRRRDTTQLVTRLHAVTEDGQTFASINNGLDYVEDHSWSDAVHDGYLTFKAGTNPYLMLSMTVASLGKYSKPRTSYEVAVVDLSFLAGHEVEAPALGDEVTVFDERIGVDVTHKVQIIEKDLMAPEKTRLTLDSKLRELGDEDAEDAGVLTTGAKIDTRNIRPFNELVNGRFDNGLAHWAASGAEIVKEGVTGVNAVRFAQDGWVEQTIVPDNFDVWTVSAEIEATGFGPDYSPHVTVEAEFTFTDGTTETITQALLGVTT
ncbi:MAG: phage tail protein [Propionibacteriaceae bacterium]|jgi:phage minor structural protein|nr:phage tail protein [Propionibacteriaceae bacterium]